MIEHADDVFFIPMLGFVQSFNVSVAAALVLYEAAGRAIATVRPLHSTPSLSSLSSPTSPRGH